MGLAVLVGWGCPGPRSGVAAAVPRTPAVACSPAGLRLLGEPPAVLAWEHVCVSATVALAGVRAALQSTVPC